MSIATGGGDASVCLQEFAMMDSPRTANKQVVLKELLMYLLNMEKE
jgi:hypothetical protein